MLLQPLKDQTRLRLLRWQIGNHGHQQPQIAYIEDTRDF
jgi:hypothetical protein